MRPNCQREDFKNALDDSQSCDLGFCGTKFTWHNECTDNGFTRDRLDRAMVNKEWCEFYGAVEPLVLASKSSDHNPIFISFCKLDNNRWRKYKKFRFEASWAMDFGYREVVKFAWWERTS